MNCKCVFCFPPFLVILVIVWSYYSYILALCVYAVDNNVLISCLYVLFFNVLFCMFSWAFLSTVFTPNATVPSQYKLTEEEAQLCDRSDDAHLNTILQNICVKKNLILQTRYPRGIIRYCNICKHIKPDRARHCAKCGVCVLKMDHHCPWVNNCIGYSNHKSFYLLLIYSVLYCAFFVGTSLEYFLAFFSDDENPYIHVVVGFGNVIKCFYVNTFSAFFSFLISCFLGLLTAVFCLFHTGLIARNETTLDSMRRIVFVEENMSYNMGCRRNFREVFGRKWTKWLIPEFTGEGTGCTFPIVRK